jgi:hypothetical protein
MWKRLGGVQGASPSDMWTLDRPNRKNMDYISQLALPCMSAIGQQTEWRTATILPVEGMGSSLPFVICFGRLDMPTLLWESFPAPVALLGIWCGLAGALMLLCRLTQQAAQQFAWGPQLAVLHLRACEPSSGPHSPCKNSVGKQRGGG